MVKENFSTQMVNQINYIIKDNKKQKTKPWIGDLLSLLYDYSMEKDVIPKKFNASSQVHNMILKSELSEYRGKILELAAGSGNLAEILCSNVSYYGIDVSRGLLKQAAVKFKKSGFINYHLYLCAAEELPFTDEQFDYCVCNLSLNFFDDLNKSIGEAVRTLKNGGVFFGSVPVPEKNEKKSLIRGNLKSEKELNEIFTTYGMCFENIKKDNGAILYFKAVKLC